jgi:hypothetical protein
MMVSYEPKSGAKKEPLVLGFNERKTPSEQNEANRGRVSCGNHRQQGLRGVRELGWESVGDSRYE